jgi:hypothetical protein
LALRPTRTRARFGGAGGGAAAARLDTSARALTLAPVRLVFHDLLLLEAGTLRAFTLQTPQRASHYTRHRTIREGTELGGPASELLDVRLLDFVTQELHGDADEVSLGDDADERALLVDHG